jgi:hypothetical protein
VEGGKADNYNLRWLLLLPIGERTVRGSFGADFAIVALLLLFANKKNGTFWGVDYEGCVDERRVAVLWIVCMLL